MIPTVHMADIEGSHAFTVSFDKMTFERQVRPGRNV